MALLDSLQSRLAGISAVIDARMTGKAVEEYKEATEQFRYTPIDKLYEMEKDLQERIAALGGSEAGGGTSFSFGVMEGN